MADTLTREAIAFGSQPLSPVPQYWDGATSYEKVQGANGAPRSMNYNSSGTEIFTGTTPGSVKLTATSTVVISGTSTAIISGTATVTFSGSETVNVSGTATVNFSGSGTVEVVASAGGTAYFSITNPASSKTLYKTSASLLATATVTWTAGTTATSVQTVSISAITTTYTTNNCEILITNDSTAALTLDVYKIISANGTFTTTTIASLAVPAPFTSAGVTINTFRTIQASVFNINKGLTLRLTTTAAFTATVTNNIVFYEST